MQLGQAIINTPKDDPLVFDQAWRHLVAMAWHTYPDAQWSSEYTAYRQDHWIQQQRRHLDAIAKAQQDRREVKLTKDQRSYKWAFNWFKARELRSPRFRIEPLLLTPISFDTIALDIGGGTEAGSPDTYKIYERLFFNIREDDGKLSRAMQRRSNLGCPTGLRPNLNTPEEQLWLVCGLQFGYRALMALWLWPDQNGAAEEAGLDYVNQDTWRLTQSVLFERALRRGMSDRDSVELLGKYTEVNKVQKDAKVDDTSLTAMGASFLELLKGTAPKMVQSAAKSVDEEAAKTAEIAARLTSQRMASGMQAPAVVPASEKTLDKMLKNQFQKQKTGDNA